MSLIPCVKTLHNCSIMLRSSNCTGQERCWIMISTVLAVCIAAYCYLAKIFRTKAKIFICSNLAIDNNNGTTIENHNRTFVMLEPSFFFCGIPDITWLLVVNNRNVYHILQSSSPANAALTIYLFSNPGPQ